MSLSNPLHTVFYQIESTIKAYRRFVQKRLKQQGIGTTLDQTLILFIIRDFGRITQKEIADLMDKDYAAATRIFDILIEKELIVKLKNPGDRRSNSFVLTRNAEELLQQAIPTIRESRAAALKGVEEEQIDALVRILKSIRLNIMGSERLTPNLKDPRQGDAHGRNS